MIQFLKITIYLRSLHDQFFTVSDDLPFFSWQYRSIDDFFLIFYCNCYRCYVYLFKPVAVFMSIYSTNFHCYILCQIIVFFYIFFFIRYTHTKSQYAFFYYMLFYFLPIIILFFIYIPNYIYCYTFQQVSNIIQFCLLHFKVQHLCVLYLKYTH